jgi:hypothetical protein
VSLELPAGSRIEGEAAVGDFRCDGRLGECTFSTSVGNISLSETGQLTVSTSAGSVTVDRVVGRGEISGSGQVRIREIDGHAVIKNLNGVTWVGEVVSVSVELRTAYGELEVGIGEGTAALLDVRSQYGSVRNSLSPSDGPQASDKTVEVHARTSFGDIVIRRSNSYGGHRS